MENDNDLRDMHDIDLNFPRRAFDNEAKIELKQVSEEDFKKSEVPLPHLREAARTNNLHVLSC